MLRMKIKFSEKLGFNCYIPEKWLNIILGFYVLYFYCFFSLRTKSFITKYQPCKLTMGSRNQSQHFQFFVSLPVLQQDFS